MQLTRLEVKDLRILRTVALRPHPILNVIAGGNAAGKTSLLEAIHVLGTGRSFRSRDVEPLVRWESTELSVFGEVLDPDGSLRRIGVVKGGRDPRIRVDGQDVSGAAVVARLMPVAVFAPNSLEIVEGSPGERRSLMDWALFHVEPEYGPSILRCRRSLRQRNAALRFPGTNRRAAAVWEHEICEESDRIDSWRTTYAQEVLPFVRESLARLTAIPLEILYRRGWPAGESIARTLERTWAGDVARGWTTHGPHVADLALQVAAHPARETLSRGEKKALAAALVLGHVAYVRCKCNRRPVLLADDFPSELDARARQWFLEGIRTSGCQTFLTVLEPSAVSLPSPLEYGMFHVEQGRLTELL